ncbi:MAG: HAD family hydrolase [Candidatus Magasanikiibacteriota bacterium]
MYIIDFDNTLFNTTGPEGFRDQRVSHLTEIGVSQELYSKTYMTARNTFEGLASYNDERHAEALSEFGFDKQKVLQALDKSIQPEVLKTFLLSDTIEFLEALKNTGESLVLLSLGDPEYQNLKFRGTGIEKYFDRVFMTNKPKKEIMEEIFSFVNDKEYWFINDRIDETLELKELHPELKVVLKVGPHYPVEDYQATSLPYFKTLIEIKDYILN